MSQRQKDAPLRQADVIFYMLGPSGEKAKYQRSGKFSSGVSVTAGDSIYFEIKFKKGRLPVKATVMLSGRLRSQVKNNFVFFEREFAVEPLSYDSMLKCEIPNMHYPSFEADEVSISYAAVLTCFCETTQIYLEIPFAYYPSPILGYYFPLCYPCDCGSILVPNVVLGKTDVLQFVMSPAGKPCQKITAALRSISGTKTRVQSVGTLCYQLRQSITFSVPLEFFNLEPSVDFGVAQAHTFLVLTFTCDAAIVNESIELILI